MRFVILFSCLLFLINGRAHGQSPCQQCQESLLIATTQNERRIEEIRSAENRIVALIASLNNNRGVPRLAARGGDLNDLLNRLQNQIDVLVQELNNTVSYNDELQDKQQRQSQKIGGLQAGLASAQNANNALEEKLERLNRQLEESRVLLDRANEKIEELESILGCIHNFQLERRQLKADATKKLKQADNAYEFYLRNKEHDDALQRNIARDTALFAWRIYSQTSWCRETNCSGYPQSYCDDYKSGLSHYYRARMVAYNDANVLNSLGSTPNEKINTANEILLTELGAAIRKGGYNDRSDLQNIVERLSELVLTERKGNGVDSTDIVNSETYAKLKEIGEAFDQKDFAKSISLYNKYQRVKELEEFQLNDEVIIKSEFAAGAILLWNLGNISSTGGFALKGSWLEEKLKKRELTGRTLLTKVATNKSAPTNLRKQAYILLKKQFHRENSN